MTEISGWGRYPRIAGRLLSPRSAESLGDALSEGPVIARGLGRAYGDAALGARVVETRHLDRFIAFDPDSGSLTAEAGVSLAQIIDAFLPRGWFPAVTPGTRFVTLGGAIAADVHGKNHHRDGSFGAFVDSFDLMGPDGTVRNCSRTENTELFHWTLGGMGLTGVILRATIRLRRVQSGWIRQTTIPAPSLAHALAAFEGNMDATYSVAWIDALATGRAMGRSLVMLGEHASPAQLPPPLRPRPFETPDPRPRRFPFDLPGFALNPLSVGAFNALYWRLGQRKAGTQLVPWRPYFYPLDAVADWNRLYGRRGFVQFQCALPLAASEPGLTALLKKISASGTGSFLAVLKRFGAQDSRLSFPTEGYTLALDFPANRRALALLPVLDRITADHGGRFYLAKDARMSAETLLRTDPRFADFTRFRTETGLSRAFVSAQSERLGI